jgi:hypothetical protein
MGPNRVLQQCLSTEESQKVLAKLHECAARGHFGMNIIVRKIFDYNY